MKILLYLLCMSILISSPLFAGDVAPIKAGDSSIATRSYQIKSAKNKRLCERFAKNLSIAHSTIAPNCDLKIAPFYARYFAFPEWEEMDVSKHMVWLWKMDTEANDVYYIANKLQALQQNQSEWEMWFSERVKREGLEVRLRRAHFDLDGDGTADTVLAYRVDHPCNPEASKYAGDHMFIFDEKTKAILLGHFDEKLKARRFIPILYTANPTGDKVTSTILFESGAPPTPRIVQVQGLSLWVDLNPGGDYIELESACVIWLRYLDRKTMPR